jgi:sugar phosphate permease
MLLFAWITYASFYLIRVNYSVALPLIIDEFGYTETEIGLVATCLFAAYAIGQFINGQLGDKFRARRIIALGLITSAVLNILFGTSSLFIGGLALIWTFAIIWFLNGYFQSMGWAPTVKTIANWFSREERGRMSGFIGTSYIIGGALSWLLAGIVITETGDWRWAFWFPAVICLGIGIHWYLRAKNAPEEVGLPTLEEVSKCEIDCEDERIDHHIGFKETLRLAFTNRYVWFAAFTLFFLNVVRYGFMTWAVKIFWDLDPQISTATYKALLFPIAGAVGAIFAGWYSDRHLKTRRAPIAAVMMFLLAIFCALLYYSLAVVETHWIVPLIFLVGIGFTTFGPHMLVVTAIPMDFGSRKAASSVTGFIDGWGYVGAAITGVGSGWLLEHYDLGGAFSFWIAGAIIGALLMVVMWNVIPKVKEYH